MIGSSAPASAFTTFMGRTLLVLGALIAAFAPAFAGGIHGMTAAGLHVLAARRSPR